jgi:hypothetical protein
MLILLNVLYTAFSNLNLMSKRVRGWSSFDQTFFEEPALRKKPSFVSKGFFRKKKSFRR